MTYTPVSLIHVSLEIGDALYKVGRLGRANRRIYFEYDQEFLSSRIEISPFKLPLKSGALPCEEAAFEGLFGVFNDSLPDGWGRLLLDRQVRKNGMAPEQLTPLDRLTHVGRFGMGALYYEPDANTASHAEGEINLDKLSIETREVLKGEPSDVFEKLLCLSGSSAGARPKVMLGVSSDKKQLIHGQQQLTAEFEHWMVKFVFSNDSKDAGAVEYAYSLMARDAGLEMMPTHLFRSRKGLAYFGVQRFDRLGNRRLHMHTASGLLHTDHRLPSLDYELLMRATLTLTRNVLELEKMFRLATFNVFSHNRDDHAKNFSYRMDERGNWSVAPACDLTFSGGPGGEHSTTIMGEGRSPGTDHLLKLAKTFGIAKPRAAEIIEQVRTATNRWPVHASQAGVGKSSLKLIGGLIASTP